MTPGWPATWWGNGVWSSRASGRSIVSMDTLETDCVGMLLEREGAMLLRNAHCVRFVYAVPRCTGRRHSSGRAKPLPSFIVTAFVHVAEAVTVIYRRTPLSAAFHPSILATPERGNGALQPLGETSRSPDHHAPGRIPPTAYIHQLRPRLGNHHSPLGVFLPFPAMCLLIPLRRACSTSSTRLTATAACSV